MIKVSFADSETGVFSGVRMEGDEAIVYSNLKPGQIAVPGFHDHNARRYNAATGQVVPWQPPAPADTDEQVYEWDPAIERWVPRDTMVRHRRLAWRRIRGEREVAAGRLLDVPGGVPGQQMDVDLASVLAMLAHGLSALTAIVKSQAVGAAWGVTWTLSDNSRMSMGAQQMLQCLEKIRIRGDDMAERSDRLRAAVAACQTPEELEAISWVGGAPTVPPLGGVGNAVNAARAV